MGSILCCGPLYCLSKRRSELDHFGKQHSDKGKYDFQRLLSSHSINGIMWSNDQQSLKPLENPEEDNNVVKIDIF